MTGAPYPPDEDRRQKALDRLDLLDTERELGFDALAKLASSVCGTPIALVTLVDRDRQWFKAAVGLQIRETPRDQAFCAYAILTPQEIFEVEDATIDERFAENPLVTSMPNVRFYAGVPLMTDQESSVGTLCVIDTVPRRLTAHQREQLRLIAGVVVELIEARARIPGEASERINLLMTALDNAPDPIVLFDAPPFGLPPRIRYVNRNFETTFGFTSDEVVGATPSFMHGSATDPNLIAEIRTRLAGGRALRADIVYYDSGNQPIACEVNASAVRTGGIMTHWVAVLRDIRVRSATEHRLRVLETAVEQATDLITILDTTPTIAGGPLVQYANHAYLKSAGLSASDIVGKRVGKMLPPNSDPQLVASLMSAIDERRDTTIEFDAVSSDGTPRRLETRGRAIYDARGTYINRLVVSRDITERRASEQRLQLLAVAIDHASDFVFTTDTTPLEDGGPFIEWANATFCKAIGYSLAEVIGKSPATFWGPLTDRNMIGAIRTSIEGAHETGGSFVAYRKDGSHFWVEFQGRPLLFVGAEATRYIAVGRDITQRRKLEQELVEERTAFATLFDLAQSFSSLDEAVICARYEAGVSLLPAKNTSAHALLDQAFSSARERARSAKGRGGV